MKKSITFAAVSLIAISGCAKRPDAIAPTNIPMTAYSNIDCDRLASELKSAKNTEALLTEAQHNAATSDAVGVFLVGVPTGSLVGADKEGQLAVAKGQVIAIENTIRSKNCKHIQVVPVPTGSPEVIEAPEQ